MMGTRNVDRWPRAEVQGGPILKYSHLFKHHSIPSCSGPISSPAIFLLPLTGPTRPIQESSQLLPINHVKMPLRSGCHSEPPRRIQPCLLPSSSNSLSFCFLLFLFSLFKCISHIYTRGDHHWFNSHLKDTPSAVPTPVPQIRSRSTSNRFRGKIRQLGLTPPPTQTSTFCLV